MHPITVSMRQVSRTAAAAALPATQRVMQCESGLVAGPLHHAQTESSIQCLTLPEPLTDKVSACRLQLLQSALFLSPPARPQDTPLDGAPRRPCHHHRRHRHRGRRAPHNPTKENYRRTCRLLRVSPAITRRTHARLQATTAQTQQVLYLYSNYKHRVPSNTVRIVLASKVARKKRRVTGHDIIPADLGFPMRRDKQTNGRRSGHWSGGARGAVGEEDAGGGEDDATAAAVVRRGGGRGGFHRLS